jgi:hypothetical protein
MDEPDYTAEARFFIPMRLRAKGAKDTSPGQRPGLAAQQLQWFAFGIGYIVSGR